MTGDADDARQSWLARAAQIVLGPWPLFPMAVFALTALFGFQQNAQVSLTTPPPSCLLGCWQIPDVILPAISRENPGVLTGEIDPLRVVGNALLAAAASALVLALIRWQLQRRGRAVPSRTVYLSGLVLASLAAGIVRVLVLNPVVTDTAEGAAIVANTARTLFIIVCAQSIAGVITRRYQRATQSAEDALALVRSQQRLIVESDERARREVADYLHDTVQADLLVAALELQEAAARLPEAYREPMQVIVERLERVRRVEVRGAGRRLSPDLAALGLDTALIDLAHSWATVMAVDVSVTPGAERLLADAPPDVSTAVYRITEQCLLNAAGHGRASRVQVRIDSSGGRLVLTITDDGQGFATRSPTPGAGAAVIGAWTAICGGTWDWGRGEDGVRVRVDLPTRVTGVPSQS